MFGSLRALLPAAHGAAHWKPATGFKQKRSLVRQVAARRSQAGGHKQAAASIVELQRHRVRGRVLFGIGLLTGELRVAPLAR